MPGGGIDLPVLLSAYHFYRGRRLWAVQYTGNDNQMFINLIPYIIGGVLVWFIIATLPIPVLSKLPQARVRLNVKRITYLQFSRESLYVARYENAQNQHYR